MSFPSHHSIGTLLVRAGLPDFALDEHGFPQPGLVVRHFREQMIYTDPDDYVEKRWRQTDLAKCLGISEATVRLMETKNDRLDSVARRRLLADILKIPPVLLGIGSIPDLEEFLKHNKETNGTIIAATTHLKSTVVEKETIKLYSDAFIVYNEKHSTSTVQDALFEMEQWILRINSDVLRATTSQQKELQRILWSFHILAARAYADSLCDWNQAFAHLNTSMELANLLNSDALRSLSLYRSGQMKLSQRNFCLAKVDLDGAVLYAKNTNPYIKGAVFVEAGLAHALVDKDTAGRKHAQMLIDQAGSYVINATGTDEYSIKSSIGKYHTESADAFITMGNPSKALDALDNAFEGTNPFETRRLAYIDILKAEANMKLRNPQYDTATQLLRSAFETSSRVKSEYNVSYIKRLYKNLSVGSYGNSIEVADLGLSLRNWKNM